MLVARHSAQKIGKYKLCIWIQADSSVVIHFPVFRLQSGSWLIVLKANMKFWVACWFENIISGSFIEFYVTFIMIHVIIFIELKKQNLDAHENENLITHWNTVQMQQIKYKLHVWVLSTAHAEIGSILFYVVIYLSSVGDDRWSESWHASLQLS